MNIRKYIKTQCGIEKYHKLKAKSSNTFLSRIRFYIYVIIASIRDLFR
jgi:hypothetical protein